MFPSIPIELPVRVFRPSFPRSPGDVARRVRGNESLRFVHFSVAWQGFLQGNSSLHTDHRSPTMGHRPHSTGIGETRRSQGRLENQFPRKPGSQEFKSGPSIRFSPQRSQTTRRGFFLFRWIGKSSVVRPSLQPPAAESFPALPGGTVRGPARTIGRPRIDPALRYAKTVKHADLKML